MGSLSRRHLVQGSAGLALMLSGCCPGRIDEAGFVRIGGIDQWIAVAGRDARDPVLVFLHGGPGEAQSPFLDQFALWEQCFTVVNWDQRGSGKTFARNGAATPDMTLDRLTDDAIEIGAYVRDRLHTRKVILVGHSWGSILGMHVVKRRPVVFDAFVGTGMPVSFAEIAAERIRVARPQAVAAGDQATLRALDAGGRAAANAARAYILSPADQAYANLQTAFAQSPERAREYAAWSEGAGFSGARLGSIVMSFDLRALGLDMPVPFFVIQGRDDHIVGFEPARAYLEEVRAPMKAFTPIDGGHFACFTNAAQFVSALREQTAQLA